MRHCTLCGKRVYLIVGQAMAGARSGSAGDAAQQEQLVVSVRQLWDAFPLGTFMQVHS